MNVGHWVSVSSLLALAIGHSSLGETRLIGPLSRGALPPLGLPQPFAKRVLRFAWHLTSLAWLALALALWVAPDVAWVVGSLLAISGLVALVASRGRHFAWALFALGALGVAFPYAAGSGRVFVAGVGALVAGGLAALHMAWGAGSSWGLAGAIPIVKGEPAFRPGWVACMAVAFLLSLLTAVFLSLGGLVALPYAHHVALLASLAFAVRAVGDFRYCGLFRSVHRGVFAERDALFYTPLCFSLCAALLWVR